MDLTGRRKSDNVEDRRGQSSGGSMRGLAGGAGLNLLGPLLQLLLRNKGGRYILIGLVVLVVVAYVGGCNPLSLLLGDGDLAQTSAPADASAPYQASAEEEELADFSRQILASTEDIWSDLFRQMGKEYRNPTLVLFTNSVQSACGGATVAVGPFYCSGDEKLYIDLSFFQNMKRDIGADGDFAYAYVIAHEVGHHVENLLGILGSAHSQMNRLGEAQANQISVRLELLADYYAGVWGHYENRRFRSLEQGDLDEAIDAALKIGDDYLQKKARGYAVPESFTHGKSEQRKRWLKLGYDTGDMQTTTFAGAYDEL